MGKLNNLTITRLDIAICCDRCKSVSPSAKDNSLEDRVQILRYLKKTPGKGLLYLECGRTRVADFSNAD